MTHDGKRFLAGRWPKSDEVFKNRADPCTGYGGSIQTR
jgi:hypothetical protein